MAESIRHRLFAALAGFTVLLCLCYTGLALVIAYVTEDMLVQRLAREAGGVVAGLALALTGLALLLAYWLARRLVLPLQRLAQEARQLAPGGVVHFSERDRPDEIGFLARRLEATFAELQTVLRREQAFARDVSHELRTPLTLMHNSLALAGAQPLAADGQAQLRQGVDDMRANIEVLFALARAEQLPGDVVELRGCIERCLLRLLDKHRWDASLLALDLPERLDVVGNGQLTMLLINNCLANALFHGGPACRISIAFAQGRLSIGNTVAAGQPRRVQGFAHGQSLLGRVAQAMRWDIRFHPGEEHYRVDILPLQTR